MPAPHLEFPFRLEGARVATTEQNTPEEIRNCVIACLRTRRGSLLDFPEFGVPNELFDRQPPVPSVDAYVRAVEEGEPRASLLGEVAVEGLVRRIVFKEG